MTCPLDNLDPPVMYRVRPYFEIKKVKLPDCMYLMKPVHQIAYNPSTAQVRVEGGREGGEGGREGGRGSQI